MSPTSYQAAPPRINSVAEQRDDVKFCTNSVHEWLAFVSWPQDEIIGTRPRIGSVSADIVLPHIVYRDVGTPIQWLSRAFAFGEHYRYSESSGAQMHLGDAWIMVRKARPGEATPLQLGCWTQSLTVFMEDVEAHYKKAKAAGSKIIEELNETAYGEFQYGVEDLDGHRWLFARHARGVNPETWGAKLAD
jgi:uncharacterized glyoxalase superfamily protein PhnB